MTISIASTNARLDRARAAKQRAASEALANVAEDDEEEEKAICCEVCETVIDNEVDINLCKRISQQTGYEPNLQIRYNAYRVEKQLEPINFGENAYADPEDKH